VTSCKPESPEEIIEPTPSPLPEIEINLISPNNTIEDNQNITFLWETSKEGKFRFQFDDNLSFQYPIVDFFIEEGMTSYDLNRLLAPNSCYYWRVSLGEASSTVKFNTEDNISQYQGNYKMNVTQEDIIGGVVISEITYTDTIEIDIIGNKVILDSGVFDGEVLSFWVNNGNPNTLVYLLEPADEIWGAVFTVDSDTVGAFRRTGGLGGHTSWSMRGVKIE